jgi:cyclohexanone monooxygenase
LAAGTYKQIEPTQEATDSFNDEITAAMKETVWVTGGCTSWYYDKHGKVVSWPWTYDRFEAGLRQPRFDEFHAL